MKLNERQWANICVLSVCILLWNWVDLQLRKMHIFPLYLLAGLFFWVVLHYTFFSLNSSLELSEIKGLWLRAFSGSIAAIGLAIGLSKYPSLSKYFYVALFFTPGINVAAYLYDCYLKGGFISPNTFVFFLFAKIETAYFGAIAAAVASGNLIYLLENKIDKSKAIQIFWWLFGLIIVVISAVISSTKNGVAIALALCLLLALVILVNTIKKTNGSKFFPLMVVTIILILAIGAWKGHKTSAYRGWDTVFQDMVLAIDIDGNKQWQRREGSVPMPMNSLGMPAAINTYSRVAYAAVGMRLIFDYPLGYGSINRSFAGLQEYADLPHEHEGQVHSGWIDFGLAFGVPGLALVFLIMISIIFFALRSKASIALPWAIVCLALLPFGLIAEITYKQYFEATIFFLTLGASIVALTGQFGRKINQ